MKFTMREARAGHGPGLHLSVEARIEADVRCAGWAHDDDCVVTSVGWGPHHSCPDIRVGISGPRQQVRERE